MSYELIQRIRNHLGSADLLDGYEVKIYRWSDQDLRGSGQVIRFRMVGGGGFGAHVIQRPDVEITMLCSPDRVVDGDSRMLQILQYFRSDFTTEGVFNMWPVSNYTGPIYLENNRAMFSLTVRTMTEDH